jgi:hypothetical protein
LAAGTPLTEEKTMPVIPITKSGKPPHRPKGILSKKKILDPMELQIFWSAVVKGEITDEDGTPRLNERLRASELLAKAQNVFTQNLNINSNTNELEKLSDAELEAKMAEVMEMLK